MHPAGPWALFCTLFISQMSREERCPTSENAAPRQSEPRMLSFTHTPKAMREISLAELHQDKHYLRLDRHRTHNS